MIQQSFIEIGTVAVIGLVSYLLKTKLDNIMDEIMRLRDGRHELANFAQKNMADIQNLDRRVTRLEER